MFFLIFRLEKLEENGKNGNKWKQMVGSGKD